MFFLQRETCIMQQFITPLLAELASRQTVVFPVRIHPHAKKTEITEILEDGSLKISVKAPAESGWANVELIKFLSKCFDVLPSQVSIISGTAARRKRIRIRASA